MNRNDIVNQLRDELAVYHKVILPLKPEHDGLEAAKRHLLDTHDYPDPTVVDRLDEDGVYAIYDEAYDQWLEDLHLVVSGIIGATTDVGRPTVDHYQEAWPSEVKQSMKTIEAIIATTTDAE